MKTYKYIFGACLLIGQMAFTSCNNDDVESLQTDDYTSNIVYMLEPVTLNHSIQYLEDGSFIKTIDKEETLVPVKCRFAAESDINVDVTIDNALVDAYNKEHDTAYKLLSSAKLEKTSFTIKKGEYLSADSIKVQYTDAVAEEFMTAEKFMLPLRITVSSSAKVSEDYNSFLLTYNANQIKYILDEGNNTGSNYGVAVPSSDIKYYKNGASAKRITGYWDYNTEYKVEFSEVTKVKALFFGGYSSYYMLHDITIATSEDGETWQELGEVNFTQVNNTFVFPKAMNARYIRFFQLRDSQDEYLNSFSIYKLGN